MATENSMRIVDSGGAGMWGPSRGTASLASSVSCVATDEMVLHRGHNVHSDQSNVTPNRSGSAPPSIEGALAAIDNLINKRPLSKSSLAGFRSGTGKFHPEDLQRADPSYSTYYHSSTELNPRLPPCTISRENCQLACNAGISGNNWRLPSLDGCGNGFTCMPRSSLLTHEEPEEDGSVKGTSDDRERISSAVLAENTLSFSGHHKSLVDLIQEDFPHTRPVFSQNCPSGHVKEPLNHDMQNISLDSLCLKASKSPEAKLDVGYGCQIEIPPGSTATKDPLVASASINSCTDGWKDVLTSKDACFTSDFVSGGAVCSDASKSLHKVEDDQDRHEVGFDGQNELHLQNTYSQHVPGCLIPGSQVQGTVIVPHDNIMITSMEMQPPIHASGAPSPLFATTAAYIASGNSFYANFGSPGLCTPQYSGYAMSSSFLPPYLAGYPPHTGFPLHFSANSGRSVSGRSAGLTNAESISRGSVMQNLNKFYGHHGQTIHPTVPDPLFLHYPQQSVQDQYVVPVQCSHFPSPGMISQQVDSFGLQNNPTTAAYTCDQKFQLPPSGNVSYLSPRKMRVPNSCYLSSPPSLAFLPQFPASPLSSPVLPDSLLRDKTSLGKRFDMGFSQVSPRNVADFAMGPGQRGTGSINDHRKHSVLEELKAIGARRIDLSDIVGRIIEFSIDQHGSRFIQQKLETCRTEEKELVFKEVLPHASKLITDVFGNYVIQKFFEHGTKEQRKELASQLSGQMLPLSLETYGCRVIQKALEAIEVEQRTELVIELDGHVMRCVRDQNGNHVIQKCIECVPAENIDFIISAFRGQVNVLSSHPYGCRVIQRILDHCSDYLQCQLIVDEILESACELAQDQYGNYVTQHVLEKGKPCERSQIISKLSGKIVQMSQHKCASNVVEKCLEFGNAAERELLIEEILMLSEDNDNLLTMMKDQFANYVVQKMLEISNKKQRETLSDRIQLHLLALKKYTYGKHIVARFEQLNREDNGTRET